MLHSLPHDRKRRGLPPLGQGKDGVAMTEKRKMRMKGKLLRLACALALPLLLGCAASAEAGGPQREVKAVAQGDSVVVTWQRLATDSRRTKFKLLRNGEPVAAGPLCGVYRYVDRTRRNIIRRGCLPMPEDVTYEVVGGSAGGSCILRGRVGQ